MHRRAWRDREGAFLLEGPIVIREALEADLVLRDVFVVPEDREVVDLAHRCGRAGARVVEVGENVLKAVADAASPQDIVAVAQTPSFSLDALDDGADLVLVLAQVRDPGNAGTMTRTAAAAGAACVVFGEGSVDPFGPKTVRASAGAVFKLPIARSMDLSGAAQMLRSKGFRCVAAEAGHPSSIYELDLSKKVALIVGNEAWGFGDAPDDILDEVASIPMAPGVESLNVSAAGAVFLFEAVRQRRLSSGSHG